MYLEDQPLPLTPLPVKEPSMLLLP